MCFNRRNFLAILLQKVHVFDALLDTMVKRVALSVEYTAKLIAINAENVAVLCVGCKKI